MAVLTPCRRTPHRLPASSIPPCRRRWMSWSCDCWPRGRRIGRRRPEAVVEAIRRIERELQAERQRAELSPAAPPPAVADPRNGLRIGVAGEPGTPRPAAKARRVRRSLGIAAAAVLLGLVAISMRISLALARCQDDRAGSSGAGGRRRDRSGSGRPAARPASETAPARDRLAPGPHEAAGRGEARERIDERPREATPDRDPPRQEGPLKPPLAEAVEAVESALGSEPDHRSRRRLPGPPGHGQDRASILVPGIAHLLSAEIDRMNAPRILREVTGDFEVRVKVTGITAPEKPGDDDPVCPLPRGRYPPLARTRGITSAWRSPRTSARGWVYPYANFELRQDGLLATSRGLKIEDDSSYLRLQRQRR